MRGEIIWTEKGNPNYKAVDEASGNRDKNTFEISIKFEDKFFSGTILLKLPTLSKDEFIGSITCFNKWNRYHSPELMAGFLKKDQIIVLRENGLTIFLAQQQKFLINLQ
jgi:hypothetical protein